jgi:signal transduction histidine kinase/DNA-binding response OmpR family regulator
VDNLHTDTAIQTAQATLSSAADRRKVLSGLRIKVALSAMVVLVILLLAGTIFFLVDDIFESLTPTLRRDLEWKTERGVAELSKTTELAVVAEELQAVKHACRHYVSDDDVLALRITGAGGRVLYAHGAVPMGDDLWKSKPDALVKHDKYYAAWAPIAIEGMEVGRVALVLSTKRLSAGMDLRREILTVAGVVAFAALLLALGFVALYIGPLLAVTENAFRQLERTTELALESARLKSQFLANMSHEIRTPMNGVLGMTRLMLDMHIEPKLRRYVETIDGCGRGLMTIINDVLDFSKIESGKYTVHPIEFDLPLAVQELAELFAERAHAKELELVCRISPEVPTRFVSDPDRLRQVLGNLIGNAVKFTERGEVYIDVSVDRSGSVPKLRIGVSDTGIGIPQSAHALIFEAFSQQDGSSVRAFGGTGLGLAIAKRLVEIMGGDIGVTSAPGQGSTFYFTLPLTVDPEATAERPVLGPAGRRVLLVEGNEHLRQMLTEHLTAWGLTHSSTRTGEEALWLLAQTDASGKGFDIMIIGSSLADMRGRDLIERARSRGVQIPFVYLAPGSARPLSEDGAGVHVLQLTKPVRTSELYNCLASAFSGHSIDQATNAPRNPVHSLPKRGSRVLVVDDNEVNQFVAAEQMTAFGYEVDIAANGQEAVEMVKSGRYAAVLMDCQMPVMDGYAATRAIREMERDGRHIPIIALTAHALVGERERVFAAGMDDYLTKPVRVDALRKTLARLLGDGERATTESDPPDLVSAEMASTIPELDSTRRSAKVIELVLKHVPQQLDALEAALQSSDAVATRAQAHKLKGSTASIGARRMATVSEALQRAAETGDLGGAPAAMKSLRTSFSNVRVLLERELAAGGPKPGSGAPAAH